MIRNRLNARQQPPGFRLEFRNLIVRLGKSLHRIERIKEVDYDDIMDSIDKELARPVLGRASEGGSCTAIFLVLRMSTIANRAMH